MKASSTHTRALTAVLRGAKNALFWSFLAVIGGCTGTMSAPPTQDIGDGFTDQYLIGVGDTLYVNVWRHEDLSLTVPVRPDGKISVPLIGDILVGNKSPEKVSENITTTLSEIIRDPVVTVIVTNMGSAQYRSRVRVTGAVNTPISVPFRQGMTVLDVVLEAGGISEFANSAGTALYRVNQERVSIDLRGILRRGDMRTNYPLVPGDVITVPERAF